MPWNKDEPRNLPAIDCENDCLIGVLVLVSLFPFWVLVLLLLLLSSIQMSRMSWDASSSAMASSNSMLSFKEASTSRNDSKKTPVPINNIEIAVFQKKNKKKKNNNQTDRTNEKS